MANIISTIVKPKSYKFSKQKRSAFDYVVSDYFVIVPCGSITKFLEPQFNVGQEYPSYPSELFCNFNINELQSDVEYNAVMFIEDESYTITFMVDIKHTADTYLKGNLFISFQ